MVINRHSCRALCVYIFLEETYHEGKQRDKTTRLDCETSIRADRSIRSGTVSMNRRFARFVLYGTVFAVGFYVAYANQILILAEGTDVKKANEKSSGFPILGISRSQQTAVLIFIGEIRKRLISKENGQRLYRLNRQNTLSFCLPW